jgi:putative ABC transport system permease protein
MKGPVLAISLVLGAGVATFVMSLSTLDSLQRALDEYYERYRFADVFVHLKRAPEALRDRLAELTGVASIETRIAEFVTLDVPGMVEPGIGRLVSIPDHPRPGLNELYLRSGRYVEVGSGNEVVIGEAFATAHRLQPGDTISAIIGGRKQTLRIVGIALSPEFIYQFAPGELLPDDRRFAVLFMANTELAAAFGMRGAFNEAVVSLTPDAMEPEVLAQIDRLTAPYGGWGAYGRSDQASHRFVTNEMNELRSMTFVVPVVFLLVAAMLLNVVITRLIQTQRDQVAALKAFGYRPFEIGGHYLQFVLILVSFGVALGTVAGSWLGRGITEFYTQFFRFPIFEYHLDWRIVLVALAISTAAGVIGTWRSVAAAMRLPPAQAMRPEPPATFGPTLLERLGLQQWFSPLTRMYLRHLERRPIQSLITCLGIALATAILVLGNFTIDAVEHVIDTQFFLAQRQDVTLTLTEPGSGRAIEEVLALPGVRHAEGVRDLPVRLWSGHRQRRVMIQGIAAEGQLTRLLDTRQRLVRLPPEGLVLSAKLAELLHVQVGDSLRVEVMEGKRPVSEVLVAGLIDDFSGLSAYMDRRAVNRMMDEGELVSGLSLAVDQASLEPLFAVLKDSPRVAFTGVKSATVRSFRQTIAQNLMRMRTYTVLFATVIAVGVVYNSARITLAERTREFATLRVVGFTRGEVTAMLLSELGVLTLLGIPLGLIIGRGLAALVIRLAFNTEIFRIPLFIDWSTFGFAALVTLVGTCLSAIAMSRQIAHLDLVSVLKSRE